MANDDGDDAEVWMAKAKRRAALRVLFAGLLVLLPSAFWFIVYSDWDAGMPGSSPITRVRVVGICVMAIGALMSIAGAVMLARSRSGGRDT